jgi:hypothetical protein
METVIALFLLCFPVGSIILTIESGRITKWRKLLSFLVQYSSLFIGATLGWFYFLDRAGRMPSAHAGPWAWMVLIAALFLGQIAGYIGYRWNFSKDEKDSFVAGILGAILSLMRHRGDSGR